jgi:protoheme IX farnesyltransferase
MNPSTATQHHGDAVTARAEQIPVVRRHVGLLLDLVALTKPRITAMVVVTGLGGMWLAAQTGAAAGLSWRAALIALGGLAMVVSGAGTLNMYLERDSDGLMVRTAGRPLPARRLEARVALWFGMLLSLVALPLLMFGAGVLPGLLAAVALFLYVFVYTPLKRVTSHALLVGAVPGAMPPLIGWTAASGHIGLPGLALFAILYFWQLPHFIAIATFRRKEFDRAGIVVLPAEKGDVVARWHALGYTLALVLSSLALIWLGVDGVVYRLTAVVLGVAFVVVAAAGLFPPALQSPRAERWARQLFVMSLLYLPLLIAAFMVSA